VNEAIAPTCLAGGQARRIRGALQSLLTAAPLFKSAVSRVVATLKDGLASCRTRSLADIDAIYLYLDAPAGAGARRLRGCPIHFAPGSNSPSAASSLSTTGRVGRAAMAY
jgi:hypothetical protein